MRAVSASREPLNLSWLLRLRWGAAAGQSLAVMVAEALGVSLPHAPLWTLIGLTAASNLFFSIMLRRGWVAKEWQLAAIMASDVLVLTSLLYLTGGPFNPFSFLYLVHISLAVVLLRAHFTWALAALSLACSALLFVDHMPLALPARTHMDHMRWHLWGMWIAFAVAAAYIIYSQVRVLQALGRRESELAQARERAARQERLVALATLAGGAAHELASPLSTIAVIARELERELAARGVGKDLLDDVVTVRAEVESCREILSQMAAQVGESAGEGLSSASVGDVVARSMSGLRTAPPVRVDLGEAEALTVHLDRALAQALRVLIRNAQDASPAESEVLVTARVDAGALRLAVRDDGAGMTSEVLARAGEPFFTTKPPGEGMGLGLFLSRAVSERLGGELELVSQPGRGTTAVLVLPIAPAAEGAPA